MGTIDSMERKRAERIKEFKEYYGINADRGRCLGLIEFSAKDADKILRLLRKAKKSKD